MGEHKALDNELKEHEIVDYKGSFYIVTVGMCGDCDCQEPDLCMGAPCTWQYMLKGVNSE